MTGIIEPESRSPKEYRGAELQAKRLQPAVNFLRKHVGILPLLIFWLFRIQVELPKME